MSTVLLPSDLPSWKSIQNRLWTIQSAPGSLLKDRKYVKILAEIREISDISFANDKKALKSFEDFVYVIEKRFNDADRSRFFHQTLPYMARYAMSLKELAPRKKRKKTKNQETEECGGGLCFSISKTNETTTLDRRFVASLIANAFFSTFPKREVHIGLMVPTFRFENLFPSIRRSLSDGLRFKNLLNYFSILESEDAYGFVHYTRQYDLTKFDLSESSSSTQSSPLCSVFITDSEEMFSLSTNSEVIVRDEKLSLKSSSLLQHPEAMAALCFLDKIAPGESLKISGLLSTGAQSEQKYEENIESWDNCRIRMLDTADGISKDLECFLRELKRYALCLKDSHSGNDLRHVRSESSVRTMDFSSKSSLIDELLAFDEKKSGKKSDWNKSAKMSARNKTKPKKRATFSERLKAALERGNTPDSLTNGTHRRCSKDIISLSTPSSKEESDGFFHDDPDSSLNEEDSLSSDYSFEYVGGRFDVDEDLEVICHNLFTKEESSRQQERTSLLQSLVANNRRRALSDSYEKDVLKLETEATLDHHIPQWPLRRTNSFILDESILTRPSVRLSAGENNKFQPNDRDPEYEKPIWIINPPGSVDPNRFLIQWISVSLAGVPLVIYQVSADCESLEMIEKLCGIIEGRGWGTKELMDSLHSYFSDYSLDISKYIEMLSNE
eukprot:TRINITY_DN3140_c0_g1_i1.p1 TRINITY_DN3140_c0_g1~~TRINITY_DN3140_c0_g1_i1.p1  ORF type:complete len:670 (-),score=125.83 TRINITY_DN3140_c0_g1_i1:159-2168(-)